METFGYARPEVVAVPTTQRRFLSRDGSIRFTTGDSVFYTSWDTVLRSLRSALGPEHLHNGMSLRSIAQTAQAVECTFENGQARSFDLVVAADGIGSSVRRQLLPETEPSYAGYVGWRGLVPEAALTQDQSNLIRDSFVLYDYPHSHILNYLIPGESGSTRPGERRWNWVWYVTQTREELATILTDHEGHLHRASLGPGELSAGWAASLRERARERLPKLVAEVVEQTRTPFVQAIFDLQVQRMVFDRIVLLGDSACAVRPHTAAGASKAAGDAISLAHSIRDSEGSLGNALSRWEQECLLVNANIAARGKLIAVRGGLGS